MKTGTKIFVASISLVMLSLTLFLISQRNNLSALFQSFSHTEQDIAEQIEANREALNETLQAYVQDIPRDFTPEEEQQILTGELEPEEALEQLLTSPEPESMPLESPSGTSQEINSPASALSPSPPSSDKEPLPAKKDEAVTEAITNTVAQLYLYKASYLAKLGRLEQSAIDTYLALPPEDQTSAAKQKILLSLIPEAVALEKTCDGQVEEILRSLETMLSSKKADLSIVAKIQTAYENEKSLKKAYYLSKITK